MFILLRGAVPLVTRTLTVILTLPLTLTLTLAPSPRPSPSPKPRQVLKLAAEGEELLRQVGEEPYPSP